MTSSRHPTGEPWDQLADFLHREVFPDAQKVRIVHSARPDGGASWETFFLDVEVQRTRGRQVEKLVVKRAPPFGPLAPYEVSKDVAIFTNLAASDVPVPNLLAWTEDPAIFVRPFTVTGFVEGATHDITKVETWSVWQSQRDALGLEIIDTLAALQRVRWQGTSLPEVLGPRGSAQARAERLVDRFLEPALELASAEGVSLPLWREMGGWLKLNAPDYDEDEMVVVHGDYRFGNFIWQDTSIAAVVDWERAMLGPPMQELGFICMPLSRRQAPEIMGKALPLDRVVERYESATGRKVDIAMVQYYAVLWQFIEGVNSARGALVHLPSSPMASGALLSPNLVARQTLKLMDDYEAGREVL